MAMTVTRATKITATAARTISSSVSRQGGLDSTTTVSPRRATVFIFATAKRRSSCPSAASLSTALCAAIAVVISAPRLVDADRRYWEVGNCDLLVGPKIRVRDHDCGNDA